MQASNEVRLRYTPDARLGWATGDAAVRARLTPPVRGAPPTTDPDRRGPRPTIALDQPWALFDSTRSRSLANLVASARTQHRLALDPKPTAKADLARCWSMSSFRSSELLDASLDPTHISQMSDSHCKGQRAGCKQGYVSFLTYPWCKSNTGSQILSESTSI